MSHATIRGHRCYYERHGADGPRVLLVMGFGMSGRAWRAQFDDLRSDHEVVWYDNRGLGGSSAGAGRHDLGSLAADAVALLDHLRWPDAHIVGVSMGGMISQHIALNHRARVRSLALIATHPGGWRMAPTLRGLRLFMRANTSRGPERLEALAHLLFSNTHLHDLAAKGWTADELAAIAVPSDPKVRLGQVRAILGHDTRPRLPELRGLPTLIVRPGRDVLVPPRGSDALANGIPGASVLDLRSAGHGVAAEEAARVNAALRAHFEQADSARAERTPTPHQEERAS